MVTGLDIISGEIAGERSVGDNKMIRSRVTEISRSNTGSVEDENGVTHDKKGEHGRELIEKSSLIIWLSFLETLKEWCRVHGLSSYWLFSSQPLRSLHQGISKLVKDHTVSYLSLERLRTARMQGGESSLESSSVVTSMVELTALGSRIK